MAVQLDGFVKSINAKGLDLYGINVLQGGDLVAEYFWRNKLRKEIRSCTKSITSLAVGRAIDEGMFKLTDKITDFFPEHLPKNPQPELLQVTIRDILMMAMGYNRYILNPFVRESYKGDWLDYIFSEELDMEPGKRFVYNNASPYLCGALISKLSGENFLKWMMPRFFDPLEINNPQWFTCPMGRPIALGGLFLTVEELSRFGQLCLDRGMWKGKELVSAKWVDEATSNLIAVETSMDDVNKKPEKDFAAGYGYFFWMNMTEGYRMWGRYGQFNIVLPKRNAVITMLSLEENDEQGILDSVWEEILPQL